MLEWDQAIQPGLATEIASWIEKGSSLFLKAVEMGDLKSAQLLFKKGKLIADAQTANGMTALHVACTMGHKDMVEWLLDGDLKERNRIHYLRLAISYAVKEYNIYITIV